MDRLSGDEIQIELAKAKLAELADDSDIEASIYKSLSEEIHHLCLDYLQTENKELSKLCIEIEIERAILNGLVDELGVGSPTVLKYSQKLDKLFNKYSRIKSK